MQADNRGNTHSVARMMTTKFPSVVVLAELATELDEQDEELLLEWIPREQNTEADALSNGDWSAFDVGKRVHPDLATWHVLDEMMKLAEPFQRDHEKVREQRRSGRTASTSSGPAFVQLTPRASKKAKLRYREPW